MIVCQFPDGWNNPHLCLLMFCVGIISLKFFQQLPTLWLTVGLLVLLLSSIRCAWLRPAATLVLGLCWASITATAVLNTTIPTILEMKDVVISGKVIGIPLQTGHYQRFDFKLEQLEWQGKSWPTPGNIRLKLYRDQPQIFNGQQWQFSARLKRSRSYHNPGNLFDYTSYLFQHRIRATGYVREQPQPVLLKPRDDYSITVYRERVAGFIRRVLKSADRAGVVTALVVGIRNDMRRQDWELLQRTGTIHLVAISGLHIGLISGLVGVLSSWCWRFAGSMPLLMPAPKVGVMGGLLAGITYALLAGMTIPTRRAVCMLAVVALAMLFQRRPFSGETLVLVLATVLLLDPLAPLSNGFWLSFGAVSIIVLGVARGRVRHSPASPPKCLPSSLQPGWRTVHKLGAWSAIQGALFIGMAPLLLALFHQVSITAPLANLVAIPVIGMLAVPVALLGLILYSIGLEEAATLAFRGSLWVIDQLWVLLELLSGVSWSVWQQPSPPSWSLPLAAIGVLLLLSPRVIPARWTGILWLLPLFSTTSAELPAGAFRYTMLEIGHGLASVVQTRNHLLVYDTGPNFAGGINAGKTVVVPFLQQLGVSKIDVLIVSHGDNDHIGGHRAVLDRFDASRILTSVPAKIPTSQKCQSGQSWRWDGVRFEVLWPSPYYTEAGNNSSCVLRVSSEYGAALLTGDIEKPAETLLGGSGLDIAADVLQVPHQGSKTSSTGGFLDKVDATVAIVSIGYLNRYGHPHKSVSDRYARRQIPLYNTADEGAITTAFTTDGIHLQGHRSTHRKFWHQGSVQSKLLKSKEFKPNIRAK